MGLRNRAAWFGNLQVNTFELVTLVPSQQDYEEATPFVNVIFQRSKALRYGDLGDNSQAAW